MAAASGPTNPGGRKSVDKVRRLQRRLCGAAKRSPERRFHALYDHLSRSDVLGEAWKRVRSNKGAAGVDAMTLAAIEQSGVDPFLKGIGAALHEGMYRPAVVLRRYIPKADGKKRPLGIPTNRDRVVQMAAKLVLEPIFEADFKSTSYGFRPKRSATMALETLRKRGANGGSHVLDADIRDYFGSIDHEKLMKLGASRAS
jgi:group II intron reverse transcriptase/maturase